MSTNRKFEREVERRLNAMLGVAPPRPERSAQPEANVSMQVDRTRPGRRWIFLNGSYVDVTLSLDELDEWVNRGELWRAVEARGEQWERAAARSEATA